MRRPRPRVPRWGPLVLVFAGLPGPRHTRGHNCSALHTARGPVAPSPTFSAAHGASLAASFALAATAARTTAAATTGATSPGPESTAAAAAVAPSHDAAPFRATTEHAATRLPGA